MKCPKCKGEIPEDEPLIIIGVANVRGTASLRAFHDKGVIWDSHDSWDEEFKCPYCGEFFAPDFAELREKWKLCRIN